MRADRDPLHPRGSSPDDGEPLEARLARIRRATDAIAPPPSLAADVMARVASRAARSSQPAATWWTHLGPVARHFVPVATLAAAAALALAWSGQATLAETAASALDLAQDLPWISPRLRAAGTLLAVFALGAATGAAGMRYSTARSLHYLLDAPPGEARRRAMVWALDRRLSLSDAQHARVEAILAAHSGEYAAIYRRTEPEMAALRARVEGEIREVLRPDQQGKFDELAARFKARHRRALGLDDGGAPQ